MEKESIPYWMELFNQLIEKGKDRKLWNICNNHSYNDLICDEMQRVSEKDLEACMNILKDNKVGAYKIGGYKVVDDFILNDFILNDIDTSDCQPTKRSFDRLMKVSHCCAKCGLNDDYASYCEKHKEVRCYKCCE